MWKTAFFALCISAANWAFADGTRPTLQSPPPPPQPPMIATRIPAMSAGEKAHHLRLAAAELEAAGLKEEAARFHQMADVEHPASKIENNATVLLKLTFMEVSLTKLRKLGLEASFLSPAGPTSSNIPGQIKPEIKTLSAADWLAYRGSSNGTFKDDDQFLSFLKKLRQDGLAGVIAEPVLVTTSGREASFHAGGETLVAVPHRDGTMGKETKRYGTQVDFLPIVLDRDTINIKVKASIGKLVYDYENPLKVDRKIIPVIASVGMDTACTSKSGQVVVLRGLVTKRAVEGTASAAKEEELEKSDTQSATPKENTEEIALLVLLKSEIVAPMK